MADNTTLNAGTGGDTFRSDDIGAGIKMAIAKLHNGGDGVDGGPITSANPLHVTVVAASDLPLPSGASTAAKQPALGVAGTASADVITVQGIAGGTAIPVSSAAAASELHIGNVGGHTAIAAATLTRPADTTAYASADLVANSTTAGSVTPLSFTAARVAAGSGLILRARVSKTGTSITNASFRLHLYRSSPSVTNGDNGAWLSTVSDYIGSLDITFDKVHSDGSTGTGIPQIGNALAFALPSGLVVFGLLEARAAYTPITGEVFTITLELSQD